jgi:hypothetical protein
VIAKSDFFILIFTIFSIKRFIKKEDLGLSLAKI